MALTAEEQRRLLERARGEASPERDEALTALIADFRRPAMAMIQRVLAGTGAGPQHAEEAWSRAVFRFVARGLIAHSGHATPRSYFVRIAINAAVDELRKLGREAAPVDQAHDENPASLLERREAEQLLRRRVEALRDCLDALPERYQNPVRLYYLDEAGTCERCAATLGLSKSAFMQRLSRARRKLADCLRGKAR